MSTTPTQPDHVRQQANDLLNRTPKTGGTEVTNCVVHQTLDLTSRPPGCERCALDVAARLKRAVVMNSWLNQWMQDAKPLLQEIAR